MRPSQRVIVACLVVASGVWILDALVDQWFFYEISFVDSLLGVTTPQEIYTRLVMVIVLLGFGVAMARFYGRLQEREKQAVSALNLARMRQAETAALLEASRAVMGHRTFAAGARAIFDHCREVIGAPAGYISLSDATGTQNEVVFLEAGGLPCTVSEGTPMPIRGLRAEAYEAKRVIYDNNFTQNPYTAFLPEGHVAVDNVLFAPLVLEGKAVGLLGLANKPGGFTDHDAVLVKQLQNEMTERERAEALLKASEARFRTMLQTAGSFIITLTPEGRIREFNREAERVTGWKRQEVAGQDAVSLLLSKDQQALAVKELQKVLDTGIIRSIEMPIRTKEGSERTFLWNADVIRDLSQQAVEIIAVGYDITERKLAEEKLRLLTSQLLMAQENERRRLSRELHDELGQSLLVLKMQARTLERQISPEQPQLQENCRRALAYIDVIIDNVRRLSRDLSPAILEDLGLSAALHRLLEEFRRHHDTLQVEVELEPVGQYIPRDQQINIYRLFQEALTNVAKHARAVRVWAGLKKQEEALVGWVADDGAGFDLAELPTRQRPKKGLGLAAMEERVRILGGSLQVSSRPGQGTRIEFSIPLNRQDDQP
ncbi:MAG: PAS domain S-box protein [Deltaproteobacteria bacterium]|nr:PAS domain S-box protein [Deltaproteobacteria bacterium]